MPDLAYVGSSFELPPPVSLVLDRFIQSTDDQIADSLRGSGLPEDKISRYQTLWSMSSKCLSNIELADDLRASGVDARPVINELAIDFYFEAIGELVTYPYHIVRDHVTTEVIIDEKRFYIDPTWSQVLELMGLSLDEVIENPGNTLLPHERVICYRSGEANLVSEWFATIVRGLHDKVKIGVLRGKSDMLSRRLSIVDVMLQRGKEIRKPAGYLTISELESIGQRIWNPSFYRPMTTEDIRQYTNPVN